MGRNMRRKCRSWAWHGHSLASNPPCLPLGISKRTRKIWEQLDKTQKNCRPACISPAIHPLSSPVRCDGKTAVEKPMARHRLPYPPPYHKIDFNGFTDHHRQSPILHLFVLVSGISIHKQPKLKPAPPLPAGCHLQAVQKIKGCSTTQRSRGGRSLGR